MVAKVSGEVQNGKALERVMIYIVEGREQFKEEQTRSEGLSMRKDIRKIELEFICMQSRKIDVHAEKKNLTKTEFSSQYLSLD